MKSPHDATLRSRYLMKLNKHTFLTISILIGLFLGLIFGEFLFRVLSDESRRTASETLKFLGGITFMNWLKMILIPLVVSSVVMGVASLDAGHLGRIGGWTLVYYFSTMIVAVLLGVTLVSSIHPGRDFDTHTREQMVAEYQTAAGQLQATARQEGVSGENGLLVAIGGAARRLTTQMIPINPIKAATESNVLQLIVFSLLLGIVLSVIGPVGEPLIRVFGSLFQAVMKLVEWIIWLAPIGVFFLVAHTVVDMGVAQLIGPLLLYIAVVLIGLALHGLVILPLILWLFGKTNPFVYMRQMRQSLMTAFGTDSSSATLPVTIECAEKMGGVSKKSAGFVLPLGATINMDGTALYEAVAVVFLFQCYGIHLSGVELAIIAITATLAAVGAAGVPSAGLVTMVIVIEAVNNSLGTSVTNLPLAAVGIIIGVDRILDMCRTTVNVWGDAVGAKIITRIAPD